MGRIRVAKPASPYARQVRGSTSAREEDAEVERRGGGEAGAKGVQERVGCLAPAAGAAGSVHDRDDECCHAGSGATCTDPASGSMCPMRLCHGPGDCATDETCCPAAPLGPSVCMATVGAACVR